MPPALPVRAAGTTPAAAYRHLALTILALDVPTLAAQLRARRTRRTARARPAPQPARRAA